MRLCADLIQEWLKMEFEKKEFLTSFAASENYPDYHYPEIAVLGRSNVGKSSMINALCNTQKLVKTSGQPGKTRLINYFLINKMFCLVDLPGYGYAKVSKIEKEKWKDRIEGYLMKSKNLICVFHLIDIRHEPTKDDVLMHEWLVYFRIPYVVIATKSDKISKNQCHQQKIKIAEQLKLPIISSIIEFSTIKKVGIRTIQNMLDEILSKEETTS